MLSCRVPGQGRKAESNRTQHLSLEVSRQSRRQTRFVGCWWSLPRGGSSIFFSCLVDFVVIIAVFVPCWYNVWSLCGWPFLHRLLWGCSGSPQEPRTPGTLHHWDGRRSSGLGLLVLLQPILLFSCPLSVSWW